MTAPNATIPEWLRRTGTTPKQLAREVGIAYSTLMYIIRGDYDRPARVRVEAYIVDKSPIPIEFFWCKNA